MSRKLVKKFNNNEIIDNSLIYDNKNLLNKQLENYRRIINQMPTVEGEGTNITLDHTIEAEFVEIGVRGNTKQQSYTGQQLFDVSKVTGTSQYRTIDEDGWITVTYDNSNGSSTQYVNVYTPVSNLLSVSTNYLAVCEIEYFNILAGTLDGNSYIAVLDAAASSQFTSNFLVAANNYTNRQVAIKATKSSFSNSTLMLKSFVAVKAGVSLKVKFRISVIADTTVTENTFTYEPYVGGQASPNPSYPQEIENVSGEVEVKVENQNILNIPNQTKTSNGLTIDVKDNKYTTSGANTASSTYITLNCDLTLEPGTYTMATNSGSGNYPYMQLRNGTSNLVITEYADIGIKTFTLTEKTTIDNVRLYFGSSAWSTGAKSLALQIVKGSENKEFIPHEEQTATLHLPEGMEMCKIGTYQDSFVYQGGKWYKSALVRKLELAIADMNNSENYPGWKGQTQLNSDLPNNGELVNYTSIRANIVPTSARSLIRKNTSVLYIYRSGIFNLTQTQWKEQYPDLIFVLYYGLQTPDLQEITDTTLIRELNKLKQICSYYGTTHITTTAEVEPMIKAKALKDLNYL